MGRRPDYTIKYLNLNIFSLISSESYVLTGKQGACVQIWLHQAVINVCIICYNELFNKRKGFAIKMLNGSSSWHIIYIIVYCFSENPDMYCLHIAEDDGEVDTDFPSLDSKEPVSKFGFTKLALVEKDMPTQSSKEANIVTM